MWDCHHSYNRIDLKKPSTYYHNLTFLIRKQNGGRSRSPFFSIVLICIWALASKAVRRNLYLTRRGHWAMLFPRI